MEIIRIPQIPINPVNITRAAHAEIRITDLDRARTFYVDTLGMLESHRESEGRLYLRGLEERDMYSLVLKKAKSPGLNHIAFRVTNLRALHNIAALYRNHNLSTFWVNPTFCGFGQGLSLRVQGPDGIPVEFYYQMEQRECFLHRYDLYRGANIMRIDHFNCQVNDVKAVSDWWMKKLNFYLSEYTVTDDEKDLWAVWLHRKQNVHDIAFMKGIGPRFHHVGFWVKDEMSILRACDILASKGMQNAIERGPGRHGISNAFFLYLRDPDGNRIELFTGDYMIPDPDFEPIKWKLNDPRRATFWGHEAPRSWFEEASLVEDINTGKFIPTREPVLEGRPSHLT